MNIRLTSGAKFVKKILLAQKRLSISSGVNGSYFFIRGHFLASNCEKQVPADFKAKNQATLKKNSIYFGKKQIKNDHESHLILFDKIHSSNNMGHNL